MSEPQQPVFNIEKVYVKDASLEVPRGAQTFSNRANLISRCRSIPAASVCRRRCSKWT